MRRWTKITLVVIGIALVWTFGQIGLIAAQAQYYAGGRPYCIDVSDWQKAYAYRPAASFFELNGWTLRSPHLQLLGVSYSHSFLQWTFHAVLIIADGGTPEWRNWSFWHQHFDRLTPEQAKATSLTYSQSCKPQKDFVRTLPLFSK